MSSLNFPYKSQGEKIVSLRKELNLTIEQICIQVHVSPRAWERYESGQNSIVENIWYLFCILNNMDYSKLYFKRIVNVNKNSDSYITEIESKLNKEDKNILTKLRRIARKNVLDSSNLVHINIINWIEYETNKKEIPEALIHLFCLLNNINYDTYKSKKNIEFETKMIARMNHRKNILDNKKF